MRKDNQFPVSIHHRGRVEIGFLHELLELVEVLGIQEFDQLNLLCDLGKTVLNFALFCKNLAERELVIAYSQKFN
jgi:hypothetical protein